MENINKIIRNHMKILDESNKRFQDIFNLVYSLEDNIFFELTDGYRVKKVTYKDAKVQAIKMGIYFKNLLKDIPTNSFIGLMMENSPLWVSTFWGLLMAGYKPMLINIRLGSELNNDVIKMLDINTIISDSLYEVNANVINIKELDVDKLDLADCEFAWANEIAVSTSATTLNVKVCVYHGSDIAWQIKNTKKIVKMNNHMKKRYKGQIKIMTFLPFYHVFGLIATYFWFSFFGRTLVFLKDYSNDTILKTAKKHKVTHIFAVPMVWNAVCKGIEKEVKTKDDKTIRKFYKGVNFCLKLQNIFPNFGLVLTRTIMKEVQNQVFGNSIKFLITGGGYISPNTLKIINGVGYPLYNGYGMSEIGITSVELRKKAKYRTLETIGKPFEYIQYKEENQKLYVKSQSMCSRIISKNGIIDVNHDEWFCTNDLVKKDELGYYYILGRNDDVIVSSNGEKFNPDLIEKKMLFSNVLRYCVVGIEENNVINLCLILEINKNMSKIKMTKLLTEALENAKSNNIEKIYFTYDEIAAKTAIKVSRSILLKKINNGSVNLISYNDFKKNLSDISENLNEELIIELKKIFGYILNKDYEAIGVDEHFIFDLGGTSLEYLTLLVKLKEVYELDFNASTNANYTILEFSKFIMSKEVTK